jgi:hypothetical protein
MLNPYIVGSWVYGSDFYGRRDIVEFLLDERHRCVYLIGNRRSGKTSLLYHLETESKEIVLFLDWQKTGPDPIGMGRELAYAFKQRIHQHPRVHTVPFSGNDDVCQAIVKLADAAVEQQFTVLLLWDEAETLLELDQDYLKRLRGVLQGRHAVRSILTATKRLSQLNDLGRSWNVSPFLFGFDVQYITPLSDHEAADLIRQVKNGKPSVDTSDDLVEQIRELTGNQPYLIQLLCSRLFESPGRLRAVTERDLSIDRQLDDFLRIDYTSLSHHERLILDNIAEQEPITERRLAEHVPIGLDRLCSHLWGLEQSGYLRYKEGYYWIANRFLYKWLNSPDFRGAPEVVSDQASLEVAAQVPLPEHKRLILEECQAALSSETISNTTRSTTSSLRAQLDEARENLALIQERKSEYVTDVDVPLQLIKRERDLIRLIADLEAQLAQAQETPASAQPTPSSSFATHIGQVAGPVHTGAGDIHYHASSPQPPEGSASSTETIKILFLAANPSDTTRLRLDEESRAIDQALRQAQFRDRFDLRQHWAVRVGDVQELLLRHQPHIVHFSGHGGPSSEIILEDNAGHSHPVSIRALSALFSVLKDNVRCVVLNACFSEQQAQAIAQHIDCVIGMSTAIGDAAAIRFAAAFYQALGYGRDVKTAFDLGCVQIDLENLGEQDTPQLLAIQADPKKIVFVSGD